MKEAVEKISESLRKVFLEISPISEILEFEFSEGPVVLNFDKLGIKGHYNEVIIKLKIGYGETEE